MAISIDKIFELSPDKYFKKQPEKIRNYVAYPLTCSYYIGRDNRCSKKLLQRVNRESLLQKMANEAPKGTEVILDFKIFKGYADSTNHENIAFGVALIPRDLRKA